MLLRQIWDRDEDQNKVGSTGAQVKQMVKVRTLVGGELKEPKLGPRGPLWWPQTTTKVVVSDGGLCSRGDYFPCRCVPRVLRSTKINHKNINTMEITSTVGRLNTQ